MYVAACCIDLNQHVNKLKGTKSKNVDGWTIDVSRGSFTNSTGCPKAEEDDSWYGFDVYNKGSIETTLHGCGRARLDFGSCSDGYSFGETNIYLNEKIISKATAGQLSKAQCSKIRKKVQFQKYKNIFFAILKMTKNQFLHQKKV